MGPHSTSCAQIPPTAVNEMKKDVKPTPRKFTKEVYISGLSKGEDKAVIKDYTFLWDDSGVLERLVVNYRHFQDAEALNLFFKDEYETLLNKPGVRPPTVRKMLVDRHWAVEEAKSAFLQGFGVYDLITCVTGKRGPTLRHHHSNELTQKRKLHVIKRTMSFDASADCSNFVVLPGQESTESVGGYDGDLYAVFDMFTLNDRIPLTINKPVGYRMMTLDTHGSRSKKNGYSGRNSKFPMTFAEELIGTAPSVQDILGQTKSFWIPYSMSHDSVPRTLVFFTTDLKRSWQIFDASTDDEVQNFVDLKDKQGAFDFVSGQVLFRFFSNDLVSRWAEVITACGEHVMSLKTSIMTETTTEIAQKIWEGEAFWKYLDQTLDKQIEVLHMFCSELKENAARGFPLINLEDQDMQWINTQLEKLKRLIAQSLIEQTHSNIQMLFTIASLREAQTANAYGASMNRLSWVTFIFLSLTFLTGVFGMNVDTFKKNPSIVWYIVGIVLLMAVVSLVWFVVRRFLLFRHEKPSRRGFQP